MRKLSCLLVFILLLQLVSAIRVDNLNIVENSAIITIDTTTPTANNITFTNFINNTFVSRNLINITYNVSDAYNNSVLFYVNGVKNSVFGYKTNISAIATLTISPDGNYTFLYEANDSANNKVNSSFIKTAIDTTNPSSSNPLNQTLTGSTTIYANTDVNTSVFLGDIYLSALNFTDNSSGVWVNHSVSIAGNKTYSYIIGYGNFSDVENIGWGYYAFDLAGNQVSQFFSFITPNFPAAPPANNGATGGIGYTPYCGDGACNAGETSSSCSQDCKTQSVVEEESTITTEEVKTKSLFDKFIDAITPDKQSTLPEEKTEEKMSGNLKAGVYVAIMATVLLSILFIALILGL